MSYNDSYGRYGDKVVFEEVLPWPKEHVTDTKRYHNYAPYAPSSIEYGPPVKYPHKQHYPSPYEDQKNDYPVYTRDPYRGRESRNNTMMCVSIVVITVGLLALVGLGLGLGLGLSGDDDSSEEEDTSPYVLSYLAWDTFDQDLLDTDSQAYQDLSTDVIEALRPICNCEPSNVRFFEGSTGVICDLEFDSTLTETDIYALLEQAVNEGTLLPGFQVIIQTLLLGVPGGEVVTPTEPVTATTTMTTITTTQRPTTQAPEDPGQTTQPDVVQPAPAMTTMGAADAPTTRAPVQQPTTAGAEPAVGTTEAPAPAQARSIDEFTGTWSLWSTWGGCSVTCGGGTQSRTRTCSEVDTCLGVGSQQDICNETPCPRSIGVWTSWEEWSGCSFNCGTGTRLRTRTCQHDPGVTCTGEASQGEDCNTHECPDCSIPCPEGTLNVECTHCECPSDELVGGWVYARGTNLILPDVTIAPVRDPTLVLETTADDGRFTLRDLCADTELVFSRDGYGSLTVSAPGASGIIYMDRIVPLEVMRNPVSKKRLVGESVTLCCQMSGSPPPDTYEWFKDEEVIYEDAGNAGQSMLVLSDLAESDSGTYQCRANNEYSAGFSTQAVLDVKESRDDFCLATPLSHNKALPAGCLYNGENQIDVGKCRESSCRGDTADGGECGTGESFCCGPTEYTPVEVDCGAQRPIMNVLTQCGCRSCLPVKTYIRGEVIVRTSEDAVEGAEIWYNGDVVDTTDEEGRFNFTIDEEVERISITVEVPNDPDLIGTTHTLAVRPGAGGTVFATVVLLERAAPVTFDSTVGDTVTVGNGTRAWDVQIPADSLYDENGELYQGNVTVSVTELDPADADFGDLAPGDFTITDEEGDPQMLNSFGMFTIDALADDGSRLQSPGVITIEVPEALAGTETEDGSDLSVVKLWSMNPVTGRWEFESELAPTATLKRSTHGYTATIRGIPIARTWYNFDSIARQTCHSKIRVFQADGVTPFDGARVGVLQTSPSTSVSYVRAWTDYSVTGNGYCIAHICKNDYLNAVAPDITGRIFVDFYQSYLSATPHAFADIDWQPLATDLGYTVINDTIETDLNLRTTDTMGPFYNWDVDRKWGYSDACSHADLSEYSFDFVMTLSDCEFTNPDPTLPDVYDGDSSKCDAARYLQLYDYEDVVSEQVEACYIKVYVPDYDDTTLFTAFSRVGDADNAYISPGDLYGFSSNCLRAGFTCLELKTPNGASCSLTDKIEDNFTNVTIAGLGIDNLPVNALNPIFEQLNIDIYDNTTLLSFGFTYDMVENANASGIFCERAETIEAARGLAKDRCFGSSPYVWAVQFLNETTRDNGDCFNSCIGEAQNNCTNYCGSYFDGEYSTIVEGDCLAYCTGQEPNNDNDYPSSGDCVDYCGYYELRNCTYYYAETRCDNIGTSTEATLLIG